MGSECNQLVPEKNVTGKAKEYEPKECAEDILRSVHEIIQMSKDQTFKQSCLDKFEADTFEELRSKCFKKLKRMLKRRHQGYVNVSYLNTPSSVEKSLHHPAIKPTSTTFHSTERTSERNQPIRKRHRSLPLIIKPPDSLSPAFPRSISQLPHRDVNKKEDLSFQKRCKSQQDLKSATLSEDIIMAEFMAGSSPVRDAGIVPSYLNQGVTDWFAESSSVGLIKYTQTQQTEEENGIGGIKYTQENSIANKIATENSAGNSLVNIKFTQLSSGTVDEITTDVVQPTSPTNNAADDRNQEILPKVCTQTKNDESLSMTVDFTQEGTNQLSEPMPSNECSLNKVSDQAEFFFDLTTEPETKTISKDKEPEKIIIKPQEVESVKFNNEPNLTEKTNTNLVDENKVLFQDSEKTFPLDKDFTQKDEMNEDSQEDWMKEYENDEFWGNF